MTTVSLTEELRKIRDSGIEIEVSVYVSDSREEKRGWGERLFSRPWKPLRSHKWVYSPKVFLVGLPEKRVAIMSPQTYSLLKDLK